MELTAEELQALSSLTEEQLAAFGTEALLALDALTRNITGYERWSPTERQERALQFAETCDEIFYGGSQGGGKTVLALQHAYRLSLQHDNHRTLILRRTFPEVRKSLIPPSLRMYDPKRAKFLVGEFTWRFDNGSTIEFGHMEGPYDWVRYMGSEYDLVIWDELTHFTEEMYTEVNTRVRTTKTRRKQGVRPHVMATSNPGGIGHTWVRERFIDPAPPETPFEAMSHKIVYVPARLDDNPYIDDAYRNQFDSLSEARRRALLYGDWNASETQFFTEWDPAVHVITPFEIPAWWPRERGLDHGYNDPLAVVWGAWNDDILYVYKEVNERGLVVDRQIELIDQVNAGDRILTTYADTSIWNKTGNGEPIATLYGRRGLHCIQATKARVSGWASMRNRLAVRHDANGEARTKMYVFDTCRSTIRELASAERSDRNPEDINDNRTKYGHWDQLDALRYLVMSHGRRGNEPARDTNEIDTLHRHVDARRRRERRHALYGA